MLWVALCTPLCTLLALNKLIIYSIESFVFCFVTLVLYLYTYNTKSMHSSSTRKPIKQLLLALQHFSYSFLDESFTFQKFKPILILEESVWGINLQGPCPWWFFAFLTMSFQCQSQSQSHILGSLARDVSLCLVRTAWQLAGEFGWSWYYWVIVAYPMNQFLTWTLLPVKLLGTRTWCVSVRSQAVPIFFLQLTKITFGILNLHLNLHLKFHAETHHMQNE